MRPHSFRLASARKVLSAFLAAFLNHLAMAAEGPAREVPTVAVSAPTDLVQAAKAGNADAQCSLGCQLEYPIRWNTYPRELKPKRMPEAVGWYRAAAEQGSARGQYLLGLCYLEGKGVWRDEAEGLKCLQKSADQGYVNALSKLAELYARGIGEPRSESERPIKLLERAGDLHGTDAYHQLVYHYQYGIGTDRDLVRASLWYCRAVLDQAPGFSLRDGFLKSQSQAGAGQNDFFSTLRLVVAASAPNDVEAASKIGLFYLQGNDSPANPAKAWEWMTLAGMHGAMEASKMAGAIKSGLSKSELEVGDQKLAALIQELKAINAFVSNRTQKP